MSKDIYKELLTNYTLLVNRIDDHIARLGSRYPDEIVCKKGCDACCRHLTLFPIEAFCLSSAFARLGRKKKQQVIRRINACPDGCPLLVDQACVLYQVRPVICRTHGYPITLEKNGQIEIDFCPKNFKGITAFQNRDLLSLEQLNKTLMAVNQHFLSSIDTGSHMPERIKLADALFLFE